MAASIISWSKIRTFFNLCLKRSVSLFFFLDSFLDFWNSRTLHTVTVFFLRLLFWFIILPWPNSIASQQIHFEILNFRLIYFEKLNFECFLFQCSHEWHSPKQSKNTMRTFAIITDFNLILGLSDFPPVEANLQLDDLWPLKSPQT